MPVYCSASLRIILCTSGHLMYNPRHINILNFSICNIFTITKNGNVITDLHDFFQTMGNIYDGNSGFQKLSHDLKQYLNLLLAQRRSRFIHDQHFQIIFNQVSGNLDHLLLSYSKFSYFCIQVKWMLESFQNFSGTFHMFLIIEEHVTFCFFLVHINVLIDIHIRKKAQFLVDDPNSMFSGICSIFEKYFLITDIHLSFIRVFDSRDHFHQCRFTCTILTD